MSNRVIYKEVELVTAALTMKDTVSCSNVMAELGFEKISACH